MGKTSGKKRSAGEIEAEKVEADADQQKLPAAQDPNDSSSSSSSSDEEDDDLVLEGEIMRPPGFNSSDEELSSEDEEDGDNNGGGGAKQKPRKIPLPEDYADAKKKAKKAQGKAQRSNDTDNAAAVAKQQKSKKSTKKSDSKKKHEAKGKGGGSNEPTVDKVNVDFIFCDMNEKFFFGIKTLLLSNPTLAPQSSSLADLIIENVSVGTVISAEGYTDGDDDVFGFASVLNVSTNGSQPCIQYLKKQCLDHCPAQHREEMETVLSGKTKRPAGFFLHGRMINMPLEITEVLHQQLVLDMDWAVDNAEGGEDVRKSLDFGAFVVVAPCTRSGGSGDSNGGGGMLLYKHFDDEVFASNAEFVYTFDAPKTGSEDLDREKQMCSVIVMTKTGHRQAMKDLAKMIHGGEK